MPLITSRKKIDIFFLLHVYLTQGAVSVAPYVILTELTQF